MRRLMMVFAGNVFLIVVLGMLLAMLVAKTG